MSRKREGRLHLILAPGLAGIGRLYEPAVRNLPSWIDPILLSYPVDAVLGCDRLVELVRSSLPAAGRFVILGDSFSGPIVVRLAAEHPERLAAVILVATFVTNPLPKIVQILRPVVRPLLRLFGVPRFIVRDWLLSGMGSDWEVAFMKEGVDEVDRGVIADRIKMVLDADARRELRRIDVPLLCLWGEHDRVLLEDARREMRTLRTDIETIIIDGPHLLLLRNIQPSVRAIVRFLQRVV